MSGQGSMRKRVTAYRRSAAHAEACVRYFDAYVEELSQEEKESLWAGELDLFTRPDFEPPTLEEFGLYR